MFTLRRLVWLVAFALSLAGCANVKADKTSVERAVVEFHHRLDAGDFAGAYAASGAELKSTTSEAQFVALLDLVHRKLGDVRRSDEVGYHVQFESSKVTVMVTYKTSFVDGDAVETFTYRCARGAASLVGYNVRSNVFTLS